MDAIMKASMPPTGSKESEAAAVAAGNTAAKRLTDIKTLNPIVERNNALFESDCPRVCVRLTPVTSSGDHASTWAGSLHASEKMLAETLIAATRRPPQDSEIGRWKNAYSWWFGAKLLDHADVQANVIEALGHTLHEIESGAYKLPRVLCYVEGNRDMWLFFTDGRFDFSQALKADSTATPLFANPAAGSASRYVIDVMGACNLFVANGGLIEALQSSDTVYEGLNPSGSHGVIDGCSREASALRRHSPVIREDSIGCNGNSFTRINCSRRVAFEYILELPAPPARQKVVDNIVSLIEASEFVTQAMTDALDAHRAEGEAIPGQECSAQAATAADEFSEKHSSDDSMDNAERMQGIADARDLLRKANSKVGSTTVELDMHDDDAAAYMAGTLANPRVTVHTNNRKYMKSFNCRFLDVFDDATANAEAEALGGGGLAALERDAERRSGKSRAAEAESANEQLRKVETMSATGAAMNAKFEQMNAFRQYRRENGERLKAIAATHMPGSASFVEEMKVFKRKALTQASETFFGDSMDGDRVAPAIVEARAAYATQKDQIPDVPYTCKSLGPFGNWIYSLMSDLAVAFAPGCTMEDVMLCVLTSTAGFWHHENLRPNILLSGAASVGKSYTLNIASCLMPDGVSFECTHETAKAGLVEGMRTNLLQTMEELPQHMIAVDAYGNTREVESHEKDRLTNIYRTTMTIECTKDPDTNELVRRPRIFHACEEIARQAASNAPLPEGGNPQLARWILRVVVPSTDPDHRIISKMGALKSSSPPEEIRLVKQERKNFNTIQMFIEKMIEAKAISDVNMDAMTEMRQMLDFVSKEYKFDTDDPKMYKKIEGVARLCTVSYAIYVAACSEEGVRFRVDASGKSRRLKDVAVDLALEVEKYLVVTREIIVYVFSLMRSEWMPTLRQEILQTIRDIYLTGKPSFDGEGVTVGIDDLEKAAPSKAGSVPLEFCPPVHSDFRKLAQSEGLIDASAIRICDENNSTRLADVAKFIARSIKTRTVGAEIVKRELVSMQGVMLTGPVYSQRVGDSRDSKPTMFSLTRKDASGHDIVARTPVQVKPLFFCGRVPYAANTRSSVNVDSHGTAQSSSYRSGSSAPEVGGFGGGGGGGGGVDNGRTPQEQYAQRNRDEFTCTIMYEAIRNPADHRSIVHSAVKSLAHRRMIGETQTFVTSDFTQTEAAYPDEKNTREQLRRAASSVPSATKLKGRTHHITIPELPTLVTIKKDLRRIAVMTNDKPLIPGQLARARLRRNGARGQYGKRVVATPECSVAEIPCDTDSDYVAMLIHHKASGIDTHYSMHWTCKKQDLLELQKKQWENAGDGEPVHVVFSDLIEDYCQQWRTRRMTRNLINRCNNNIKVPGTNRYTPEMSAEDVQDAEALLMNTLGRSSSVVHGARLLTDGEVEMRDVRLGRGSSSADRLNEEESALDSLQRAFTTNHVHSIHSNDAIVGPPLPESATSLCQTDMVSNLEGRDQPRIIEAVTREEDRDDMMFDGVDDAPQWQSPSPPPPQQSDAPPPLKRSMIRDRSDYLLKNSHALSEKRAANRASLAATPTPAPRAAEEDTGLPAKKKMRTQAMAEKQAAVDAVRARNNGHAPVDRQP